MTVTKVKKIVDTKIRASFMPKIRKQKDALKQDRIRREMLEELGYKVKARISSVEALNAFSANPDGFDLVITDMTMPHMTGEKLSEEILSIRPGLPIILCTGFSTEISNQKSERIGIRAMLKKPILLNEIAQTIREVLEG